MSDFEFRHVPPQDIAAIRLSAEMEQLGDTMGRGFSAIFAAMSAAGVAPGGPPLARYFSVGPSTFDFEAAVPVSTPFPASGDVQPGSIGGCQAAVATHVGPYRALGQTWEALMAWVAEQGRTPSGPGWESYVSDPTEVTDEATLVTEVFLPV